MPHHAPLNPIRIACDNPTGATTGLHLLTGRDTASQSVIIVNHLPIGGQDRVAQVHVNHLTLVRLENVS